MTRPSQKLARTEAGTRNLWPILVLATALCVIPNLLVTGGVVRRT